jgi:hypothetical protein
VTVARIRDAIRENGFTAREAEIRVAGSLVQRGDTLSLVVPGTDDVFLLEDAAGASAVAELRRRGVGARAVVVGQIPNPAARRGSGPMRMLVRSVLTT